MSETMYDCNCDLVLEMQEMGIGVEEILQYAQGCLSRDEVRALLQGLSSLVPCVEPVEQYYG
jgi:hypothetical protein